MKCLFKVFVFVFLVIGCRPSHEVTVLTVKEELDFLSNLIENISEETSSKLGYDMEEEAHGIVSDYINKSLLSLENYPEPDNLNRYFKGVDDMIAIDSWHYDSYDANADNDKKKLVKRFSDAIFLLQEYAEGRLKDYPAQALLNEVCSIINTSAMLYSECEGGEFWDLLAYRLLQQMVRFCPDISLISDFVSKDGNIGILDMTFKHTYCPYYNPVFFRGLDGKWRVYVEYMFLPNRAYIVQPNGDKVRYILSKHGDTIYSANYDEFDVRYFESVDDGEHYYGEVYCHEIDNNEYLSEFKSMISRDYCVIFNPNYLKWTICKKQGEYFHRVPGTPVLDIDIEDDAPCFYLNY